METVPAATSPVASSSSLHPLLWVAGISVTLLSLVGIAALTGYLPARTAPAPERPAIAVTVPVTQPPPVAVVAPPPVAQPQAAEAAVGKTPAPVPRKMAKKKVEQNVPVTASKTAMPPYAGGVPPDYVPPAPPLCIDCGVIANVREVTREGKGSGAGAVIGGLAGGVLGSNVGSGNTRTLATIAGAVGGGLLGNTVEKSQNKSVGYQVTVRLDDGNTRVIDSATLPSWRIGDKVKLVNGAIVSR